MDTPVLGRRDTVQIKSEQDATYYQFGNQWPRGPPPFTFQVKQETHPHQPRRYRSYYELETDNERLRGSLRDREDQIYDLRQQLHNDRDETAYLRRKLHEAREDLYANAPQVEFTIKGQGLKVTGVASDGLLPNDSEPRSYPTALRSLRNLRAQHAAAQEALLKAQVEIEMYKKLPSLDSVDVRNVKNRLRREPVADMGTAHGRYTLMKSAARGLAVEILEEHQERLASDPISSRESSEGSLLPGLNFGGESHPQKRSASDMELDEEHRPTKRSRREEPLVLQARAVLSKFMGWSRRSYAGS